MFAFNFQHLALAFFSAHRFQLQPKTFTVITNYIKFCARLYWICEKVYAIEYIHIKLEFEVTRNFDPSLFPVVKVDEKILELSLCSSKLKFCERVREGVRKRKSTFLWEENEDLRWNCLVRIQNIVHFLYPY